MGLFLIWCIFALKFRKKWHYCRTPDQTNKKNQIKPKIWRGSIIAWFLSFFLSCFLVWKEVDSHLKTFTNKGCKIPAQTSVLLLLLFLANLGLINHSSLSQFCNEQEVIQQGSGGYTTRIRRLLAGFFWYRCYYPHRSRDALSSVYRIFLNRNRKVPANAAQITQYDSEFLLFQPCDLLAPASHAWLELSQHTKEIFCLLLKT